MSILELARPEIRHLKPYEAAVQIADTIRLNANESPWRSETDSFRRPLNRYPEIRPSRLRIALAERFAVDPQELLVTRGSSEAIDLLVRAFCRPGIDEIVTVEPTFSMYRHYARIQGAAARTVATDPDADFVPTLDDLLSGCGENSRLVFLCTPNNPTGTSLPVELIKAFLHERGERSVVVVDEAYIEFSEEASTVSLLHEFENLVVLRTLSKALGFAGARCGAVIGQRGVIDLLNAIQAPYAMSTPVVEHVEDALSRESLNNAEQQVSEIIAERQSLADALREYAFVRRVWPSSANFLLIEVTDVKSLMTATRDAGILLRYFGGALGDCVRISVGTPRENQFLLDTLSRLGKA